MYSYRTLLQPPNKLTQCFKNGLIFFPWSHLKQFPPQIRADTSLFWSTLELITNLWAKQAPEAGLIPGVGRAHCVSKSTAPSRYPEGRHEETIRTTARNDFHMR